MTLLQPFQTLRRWKRFGMALNTAQRASGVGNYWYWIQVPALANGIPIAELVCPLRYDVYVRRDFFSFYAAHRELYRDDPRTFVARVRETPYYVWYMDSEAVRCNPHLRGNRVALEDAFVERVRRAVNLYKDVMANGFSPKHPIILKTAELILPPTTDRGGSPTGKFISGKYFLADGCHRLALLMELGYRFLPAEFFRVKCFKEFSPFDSTSLLTRALALDEATYVRFLSTRYCAPLSFTQVEPFLNHVRVHNPGLLNEVVSALSVDGFQVGRSQ